MSRFHTGDVNRFSETVIPLFSREWFLLTAGTREKFNTMTCAWGGIGYLWNQPVTFVFVRPQRFTYGFMEKHSRFTMSFFGDTNRETLNFCGTHSGREVDKIAETGLTPVFDAEGAIYFQEARMIMICRKIFACDIGEAGFIDRQLMSAVYPSDDFHRMYVAGIDRLLVSE